MPVLVGGSWICFAIHLIEYKITGFQPYSRDSLRYIPEEELRKISDRILSRVLTLLGAASGSYYPPLADWSFELFKWGGSPAQRWAFVSFFSHSCGKTSICFDLIWLFAFTMYMYVS